MRGIILAGGAGSRLYPLTLVASKQLQAVYDKPMIYHPLTTLIEQGIDTVCIISTQEDLPRYKHLIGDGERLGMNIEYRVQPKPAGIAQAFLIAENFIGTEHVTLILGDNLFHGNIPQCVSSGAHILACPVRNPDRYGVVEIEAGKAVSIEEKPTKPKSNLAVPGFYVYDSSVVRFTKFLKPSPRGELEITDINLEYMRLNRLTAHVLPKGFVWLDAGTSESLHEASAYIQTIEKRQGIKLGCPEEAALNAGFISKIDLDGIPKCEYRTYLESL